MEKKSEPEKKVNVATNDNKKLSYEQLEQVANNLNSQCTKMYQELLETRQILANFNDVGLLLSIVEKGECFDSNFVERCTKKIQDIISGMLDNADNANKSEKVEE